MRLGLVLASPTVEHVLQWAKFFVMGGNRPLSVRLTLLGAHQHWHSRTVARSDSVQHMKRVSWDGTADKALLWKNGLAAGEVDDGEKALSHVDS